MTEHVEGPDAPFTVTLKGGAGFEAPWLVLRGTSAEDVVALLGEAQINELPKAIGEFAAAFRDGAAGAPSAPATQRGGSPSPQRSVAPRGRQASSGAPAPRQQAAQSQSDVEYHPEGVTCDSCGETVIYKKINKGARTFELWVCPNQRSRGDGHSSTFIN